MFQVGRAEADTFVQVTGRLFQNSFRSTVIDWIFLSTPSNFASARRAASDLGPGPDDSLRSRRLPSTASGMAQERTKVRIGARPFIFRHALHSRGRGGHRRRWPLHLHRYGRDTFNLIKHARIAISEPRRRRSYHRAVGRTR